MIIPFLAFPKTRKHTLNDHNVGDKQRNPARPRTTKRCRDGAAVHPHMVPVFVVE